MLDFRPGLSRRDHNWSATSDYARRLPPPFYGFRFVNVQFLIFHKIFVQWFLPGETELSSAEVQLDKGYPGKGAGNGTQASPSCSVRLLFLYLQRSFLNPFHPSKNLPPLFIRRSCFLISLGNSYVHSIRKYRRLVLKSFAKAVRYNLLSVSRVKPREPNAAFA